MDKLNPDQKISGLLVFCLILILSLIVAWKAVSIGDTIIESAPNSSIFNPAKNLSK